MEARRGDAYECVRLLGEGAFGMVYECKKGDERYAVKKIPIRKSNQRTITNEIRLLETISPGGKCHPSVTCLHEYFVEDRTAWIVLDFFDGHTLYDVIGQPLTVDHFIVVAKKIMSGIEYLHSLGVVHRDVKPENILFNAKDMKISVIDLGLGCLQFEDRCDPMSREGTPVYWPPEYFDGYAVNNFFPVDIYAYGIMLYELYTGAPFEDVEPYSTYQRRTMTPEAIPFPNGVDLGQISDPQIKMFIWRCIGPAPKDRYSASAALTEIFRIEEAKFVSKGSGSLDGRSTLTSTM